MLVFTCVGNYSVYFSPYTLCLTNKVYISIGICWYGGVYYRYQISGIIILTNTYCYKSSKIKTCERSICISIC